MDFDRSRQEVLEQLKQEKQNRKRKRKNNKETEDIIEFEKEYIRRRENNKIDDISESDTEYSKRKEKLKNDFERRKQEELEKKKLEQEKKKLEQEKENLEREKKRMEEERALEKENAIKNQLRQLSIGEQRSILEKCLYDEAKSIERQYVMTGSISYPGFKFFRFFSGFGHNLKGEFLKYLNNELATIGITAEFIYEPEKVLKYGIEKSNYVYDWGYTETHKLILWENISKRCLAEAISSDSNILTELNRKYPKPDAEYNPSPNYDPVLERLREGMN